MSHASRSVPALVLLVLVACDPGAPTRPDSVILISLDTVRADHLGCYGSERETSPNPLGTIGRLGSWPGAQATTTHAKPVNSRSPCALT